MVFLILKKKGFLVIWFDILCSHFIGKINGSNDVDLQYIS